MGSLRNSKHIQDLDLSLGSRAAMASHGGDNEWLGAGGFDGIGDPCHQLDKSTHAAASRRNRDASPSVHAIPQTRIQEPSGGLAADVSDVLSRQVLLYLHKLWDRTAR